MQFGNLLIRTAYDRPPIPIMDHDWSAWVDGWEESRFHGFGATELDALLDLHEQLVDEQHLPESRWMERHDWTLLRAARRSMSGEA